MTSIIITLRSLFTVLAAIAIFAPASAGANWPTYGHDFSNSRNTSGGPAKGDVGSLQQAWSFASTNGDFTGTPVVADDTLVAGTNLGSVYALDSRTGKVLWTRDVGAQINGTAAIDPNAGGGGTVFVPVGKVGSPRLLALSLANGNLRWTRVLTRQPGADVFGSPVYWRGTVYMGTSANNNDESTARGSVVALGERDGRLRWRTFTVPPGHDGGAVWSTPAIDTRTGRLYVGTGNAYHRPVASTTDAMLALNASNGRILGGYQTVPADAWELNNPTSGPDYDFGASPNLFTTPEGRRLVGEGSKSGIYWALDRSTMRPVWRTKAGPGSALDGGINSTAYDGARIYGSDAIDSQIFALGRRGAKQWNSFDTGTPHFSPVAVGNGVVYSVDPDGLLTARDAVNGKLITKLPLGQPSFGGVSVVRQTVYVATGIGPPPQPLPSTDTSDMDGQGSILAFRAPKNAAQLSADTGNRSFRGTCQLSGHVRFRPALTNAPQDGRVRARLHGACSGTLTAPNGNSRSISDRQVWARARSSGLESCGAGRGSGTGHLGFGAHRRLHFTYKEVRTGPDLVLKVKGADGGSGSAQGNVSPDADPAAIAKACGGTGLRRAPVDLRLATTPVMSG